MTEAIALDRSNERPAVEPSKTLRVFGGRLDGAEQALPSVGVIRIGHDFENTLVLRGRRTKGIAVALRQQAGIAQVQVLSGEVSLLGCEVKAGGWAVLPPFVPLALGEYAVAIGDAGSARWAEVPALIASDTAPTAPAPAADTTEDGENDTAVARRDGVQRWVVSEAEAIGRKLSILHRPGLLLAAAVAVAALALAQPAVNTIKSITNSTSALQENLAAAGYRDVQVERDPTTDALMLKGRVTDDQSVERLRTLVGDSYGPVTFDVTTMSGAAAAVNSLLQSQGVDAEAVPARGGLVIHTEYLPKDRLAALRTRIATDLPDTGPLRFVRDQNRGPRDLQYFFAADRFGLASLVDGDPGHIVTADGQYWFAGALLPTGHRLLSVGHGEIRFERDGLVETLRVTGSADSPAAPPAPTATTPDSPATIAGPALFSAASANNTSAGQADPATSRSGT